MAICFLYDLPSANDKEERIAAQVDPEEFEGHPSPSQKALWSSQLRVLHTCPLYQTEPTKHRKFCQN